jgi:hypothetical protein
VVETVVIDRRFRGPPESGNGGYSCGLVARAIDSPAAEVTLRVPPPLEREMTLNATGDGRVELRDGETVVAEGRPVGRLDIKVPDPVPLADAEAARDSSPLHSHHPWPMCFVCGPDRGPGDGLRVISGPVADRPVVASPWHVDGSLPLDEDGVAPEMVWAALDCPSGNALLMVGGDVVAALGRLTAKVDTLPRPGDTCVAIGWLINRDGRKRHTGSALFGPHGELVGCARAVWIELQADRLGARR